MSSEALYTTCPKCGSTVMKSEPKCQKCGVKIKKLTALHWVGIVVVALIVMSGFSKPDRDKESGAAIEPRPNTFAETAQTKPQAQVRLLQIVNSSKIKYRGTSNEIQKSQARDERKQQLAEIPLRAENWVGTLVELETNSDGLGIVTVQLVDGVSVGTWNNALSDISDNTLVQKNSPLYARLAALNEGQVVRFTGMFSRSQEDYLKEVSMTQDGSMKEPSFLFRFEKIDPLQ